MSACAVLFMLRQPARSAGELVTAAVERAHLTDRIDALDRQRARPDLSPWGREAIRALRDQLAVERDLIDLSLHAHAEVR